MASNRHLGRIVALQALYEYEFRSTLDDPDTNLDAIVKRNLQRYEEDIDDVAFVESLVHGTVKHQSELDEKLQPIAPDWPLHQVARVDRNILRLGLYELLYCGKDVPSRVAINEAVELAKSFGSDNSSKFINGVLGTAYRTLVEDHSNDDSTKV
jgi:N utilization substance protein B